MTLARPLGALVAATLTLAACGDESSPPPTAASSAPTSATGAPSSTAAAAAAAADRLPDLTVDDVAGGKVRLSDLTPAALPTLVWFWAPH